MAAPYPFPTSPGIRAALAATALAVALAGCELFNPPAKSLANQIDYLPRARQHAQMLARWWPFLVPDANLRGGPYGELPLAYPSSFPPGLTAGATAPTFHPAPDGVTCPASCVYSWHGAVSAGTFFSGELTVDAASGEIRGGAFTVSSPSFGGWHTVLGDGGRLLATRMTDPTINPLTHWRYACGPDGDCTVDTGYRRGLTAHGLVRNERLLVDVDTDSWGADFPWPGRPELVRSTSGRSTTHTVFYGNGLSFHTRYRLGPGDWHRLGPATIAGDGRRRDSGAWQLQAEYPPDQALIRWTMSLDAVGPATQATEFRIRETRRPRIGLPEEIVVDGVRDGPILFLTWRSNRYKGTVQIRRQELGWRIDGFWDTPQGDLVTLNAQAYSTGVWVGSMTGFRPNDRDQPSETGDWLMLPDGSFQSTLLFRQVDGTFAELTTFSPPEGVAPGLMEQAGSGEISAP